MNPPARSGERVARLLTRPELGAAAGAVLVWILFAVVAGAPFRGAAGTAAWLNAAAPLGILSVAVALLMIAGQFDLSVGSMLGAASMLLLLLTRHYGWSLWPAVLATFAATAAVGALNGWLVVRTRLPSFLVTLGTLFILRGATIGVTRTLTGRTQLGGLESVAGYESARWLFASDLPGELRVSIVWWFALAAAATWLLLRTRTGNWLRATGGASEAARNAGVPTGRITIALFVSTALAAALVGVIQAIRFTGADALRGEFQEFRAIVAVVIGGTLLTGGHGSALGAVFGAMVFGMVQQGIVMTGIDADWFQVFLGAMLLGAVLFNERVRMRLLRRDRAPLRAATGMPAHEHADLESPALGTPGPPMAESEPVHLEHVSVRFGSVVALEDASLSIAAGTVTCLLGDNGAGKSTLIKLLSGVHQPTDGTLRMGGRSVRFETPRDARAAGIATVYQDLALAPLLSVWRNVVLGAEPTNGRGLFRRIDLAEARASARAGMASLGVAFDDVERAVGSLSGGERQAVAIARAIRIGARVLILDEPTAALGVRQSQRVLDAIVRARDHGLAVLLVTHNAAHAWPVGDRFVILRHGRIAADRRKDEIDADQLAALMAGR